MPNPEKQLAEYNAAMSAALNISGGTGNSSGNSGASPVSSGRPSYKRLASQILESAAIKRARDDMGNTSAIEDEDEEDEEHCSTESNEPGSSTAVSSKGSHSGHSSSFGQQEHDGASFVEYRRMSDPSGGGGARAYPRPGNLVVAHANNLN
jgi:hypothetical protein